MLRMTTLTLLYQTVAVIAVALEGSRRDCNTMEKQRSGGVYSISVVGEGDSDILL
jgi:hypothetical protein